MFKQLGEELKAAREESNISIEYLSQKIKIDANFVRNFEKGDFTFLPDLYIKAFLKEIAKTIGLNENDVIQKYENAKHGKPLDSPTEVKKEQSDQPEPVKESSKTVVEDDAIKAGEISGGKKAYSKKKERITVLVILSVIVVAVAVYFLVFHNKTDEILTDDPTPPVERERFVEEDTTTAVVEEVDTYVPGDSLQLKIEALREVYIEVRPDRGRNFTQLLPANESYLIKAKETFAVVLGHSDVRITLNGRMLEHPQGSSRITFDVTQDGIINN